LSDYAFAAIRNEPDELRRTAELLQAAFPTDSRFTVEYLLWQYYRNPAGAAVGWNATAGDELAAHYVTLPIVAQLDGKARRGLLSLNTATHPRHQGQKLFTRLAEKTYEDGAAKGYEFVVGVANANSTPGFTRKLGFDLVAPLEAKVGFGGVADPSDEDLGFFPLWSDEALAWRIARPNFSYAVAQGKKSFRIFAPTGKFGIRALMFRGREGQSAPSGEARLRGPLTLYIGIDPKLRWGPTAYFEIPKRLRPSPLNLIFRNLGTGSFKITREASRIQLFDFDAY
jgi:hypothetical protein